MYPVSMPQSWGCFEGSGRVSKRNRQFLKPIVPFIHKDTHQLPNQTFDPTLLRNSQAQGQPDVFTSNNTGTTADSREATSTAHSGQYHTSRLPTSTAKSTVNSEEQLLHTSDDVSHVGLTETVRKVHNNPPTVHKSKVQNIQLGAGNISTNLPQDTNTRTKRVKFSTKRFIEEL